MDRIKLDYHKHPPPYKKDNNNISHIPEEVSKRWVVNLSTKSLTKDQISVLSHGPKFAVTQERIEAEDIIPVIESGVLGLSQSDSDEVRSEIVKAIKQTTKLDSNITNKERIALKKLKLDRSIKVLPADKGTALVVMDSKDYDAKCLEMLSDTDCYEELKSDPTASLQRQLVDKLKSMKNSGNLTQEQYQKMRPSGTKSPAPKFYGQPKIHKPGAPLRGIVSSCGSLGYGTAKELARILGPLVGENGHSVKNAKDFVDRVHSRNIEEDETQVSFMPVASIS